MASLRERSVIRSHVEKIKKLKKVLDFLFRLK